MKKQTVFSCHQSGTHHLSKTVDWRENGKVLKILLNLKYENIKNMCS